jgi:hypothetical protein
MCFWMMIAQDQKDMPISISMTILTVRVARAKSANMEKSISCAIARVLGSIRLLLLIGPLSAPLLRILARVQGECQHNSVAGGVSLADDGICHGRTAADPAPFDLLPEAAPQPQAQRSQSRPRLSSLPKYPRRRHLPTHPGTPPRPFILAQISPPEASDLRQLAQRRKPGASPPPPWGGAGGAGTRSAPQCNGPASFPLTSAGTLAA